LKNLRPDSGIGFCQAVTGVVSFPVDPLILKR